MESGTTKVKLPKTDRPDPESLLDITLPFQMEPRDSSNLSYYICDWLLQNHYQDIFYHGKITATAFHTLRIY